MVKAIGYELRERASFLHGDTVETVYLGGGTPSVLSAATIEALLDETSQNYDLSQTAEITLEGNPDDLSREYLDTIRQAGVNRLSIGVQSFSEEALQWMNRSHTAAQSEAVIDDALQAGFCDISMDLIYGLPEHLAGHWEKDLEQALAYNLPHYSCYALTVEPRTVLSHQIAALGQPAPLDQRQQSDFAYLMEQMSLHDYEHYEISNFARRRDNGRSHRSRHNSAYWTGRSYLGIGPGAHSYDGASRYWNISNNPLYIKNIRHPEVIISQEILTDSDRYNEYVMTALRHIDGISMHHVSTHHTAYVNHFLQEINTIPTEWISSTAQGYKLTSTGRLFADGAASQLFYVDEDS